MTPLDIKIMGIENYDSIRVLVLKGQIDESNLEKFKIIFDNVMDDNEVKFLILELKDLEFVNSKFVGFLAVKYTDSKEKNKQIMIVQANDNVKDVLSLVGLSSIIDQYDSLKEAFSQIKKELK